MNAYKRYVAALMVVVMCITTLFSTNVFAYAEEIETNTSLASTGEDIRTGTIGANNGFQWSYDEGTKTLIVTGEDRGLEGTGYSPFYSICHSVENIIFQDCTFIGSIAHLCEYLRSLKDVKFINCDTSQVTDMRNMFYECINLESVNLSEFDTSNVTNMQEMFFNCNNVRYLDVGGFDTSKVTNIWGMFYGCHNVRSLDVSRFDTSNVTDMTSMFFQCNSLGSLDVSGFDTSKVTSMSSMFVECTGLTTLDVSGFDTSNVTRMGNMFLRCSNLSYLDVSGFDTSKVTDMGSMFCQCSSLSSLDVSGFDTSNVKEIGGLFYECGNLKTLDFSNFDLSNANEHASSMLYACDSLETIYTPKNIPNGISVLLPCTFYDIQNNSVTKLTADNCNTYLSANGSFVDGGDSDDNNSSAINKYQYFEGGISWYDAKKKCEELGGHLLVISSQEEQEYINAYVEELRKNGELTKQNIWIGASSNNGVIEWITGESVDYTNWANGEPNNVYDMQDCVMMYTSLSVNGDLGYWNDESGNGRDWEGYTLSDTGYICEWDTGENGNENNGGNNDGNSSNSGKCGDNLTWRIEGDTLIISGTGAMYDYYYTGSNESDYSWLTTAPWKEYVYDLKRLIIEEGITHIGNNAFHNCKFVGQLILPDGLKSIGQSAFTHCDFTGDLIIPDTVENIGFCAFLANESMKGKLQISKSLTKLESSVFSDCGFTGDIVIPDNITAIEADAFYGCEGFNGKLKLSKNLKSIGGRAFWCCFDLTGDLILPEGLETIGEHAFLGCRSMSRKAYVPESVTNIVGKLNLIDIIYGVPGSYAETHAKENGIVFIEREEYLKNFSQYSIKVICSVMEKPIKNCSISSGENDICITDENGIITYYIKNVEDYENKKITITALGYEDYVCYITDFDLYSQNTIRMQPKELVGNNFFDITGTSFPQETINGPSISLFGKELPLFTYEAEIDLFKNLNMQAKVNHEEKKIEVIVGFKDGYDVTNEGKWNEDYKDFKEYYKAYTKKSNSEIKKDYQEFRKKLKKVKTNLVFSTYATIGGYLEWDYSSGEMVFNGGGVVVMAEAEVGIDVPIPPPYGQIFYVTFGVAGEIDGKVFLKVNGVNGVAVDLETTFELTISLEAGIKVGAKDLASIGAGGDGKLIGTLKLPADRMSEALSLKMYGLVYFRANAAIFEFKPTYKFGDVQIYPGETTYFMEKMCMEEKDMWNVIPRDYLIYQIEKMILDEANADIENDILFEENVFPYSSPKLARLEDGRIIAIWIKDDGSKTDNNRTTLYYSICENSMWSAPVAVYESGKADYKAQLVVDGNVVHILWQRASKIFGDEYDFDIALEHTELVYSKFEGNAFSEPVVVSRNKGLYQLSCSIAAENNIVAISWLENDENDYSLTSGTTNLYTRICQNGEWNEINTIKSDIGDINSFASGFIDNVSQLAYIKVNSDSDENKYELYIDNVIVRSNNVGISAISYQNDRFYWLENNHICYYDGEEIVSTGIVCKDSEYKIFSEDEKTAIVFRIDNGFMNELYISYEIEDKYTNPVQFTDYGKHIFQYDAVFTEGTVLSFSSIDNMNENKEDFPFSTTDLICERQTERSDISIDSNIMYDEESVSVGENVDFQIDLTNKGTTSVDTYNVTIVDSKGNILVTQHYTNSINSGETKTVEIQYMIPEGFLGDALKFIVSLGDGINVATLDETTQKEADVSNNEVSVTVGKADIEVMNCVVENGILKGTVINNGIVSAEEISVKIYCLDGKQVLLQSIPIEKLGFEESVDFQYQLPEEYIDCETYYTSRRFTVLAETDVEESRYVNNEDDILIEPVHVSGVSIDITETVIAPEMSIELNALVQPIDALEQGVTWISDATDVATVDQNGVVTAIAGGVATITAITYDGGFTVNCIVKVVEHVHEYSDEWTIDIEPSKTSNGFISRHCLHCESRIDETEVPYLTFSGASLTLYDDLSVNYKVSEELFGENGYADPYVKFIFNNEAIIVDTYSVVDGKYVFDFDNISPNQMNDTIYATLYADVNGMELAGEIVEYSVADYCYNMLEKCAGDEYAEFRTLLVDLLNYGTESQKYTDYNTENLVNSALTDEQILWGTAENPELESVLNKAYETIENPRVTWLGAGLTLQESVVMRFKFTAEAIENLTVKITSDSGEWIIPSSEFEKIDGGYYVYFDALNAGQMSEAVYVTVYDGDTAVSNTVCYSIESYAYSKKDSEDEKLVNLLYAMMKYGNSAYEYVH